MSHFLEHPQFYNHPVLLSPEHLQNPIVFLAHLFTDYQLCEVRKWLDDISETCLTTDDPVFNEPSTRANFLLFHKNAEMLFEAAFLILEQSNRESETHD